MSSETTFMSAATYTCNAGYNLTGLISRTCGSDGVWSPDAPTCHSKIRVSVCILRACFIIIYTIVQKDNSYNFATQLTSFPILIFLSIIS